MLHDLQRDFAAMALGASRDGLATALNGTQARRLAGLAIYRNNILSSLSDALADTFPAVQQIGGRAFFSPACAQDYIKAYPTANPVLDEYGAHFAEFLSAHDAASSLPLFERCRPARICLAASLSCG